MAATALAEKYQTLGFRVIEGGKSGKLVILNTAAVAEMFDLEHRNVTRDLEVYRKSIRSNLSTLFEEHCKPSTYTDSRGRTQDCSTLTKVGFLAFATKYDSSLRFLLALAFDALEHGTESDRLVAQINARIRELRSRTSGQDELILEPPQTVPSDANQRHLDAICGTGRSVLYDTDANQEAEEDATLAANMRAAVTDALQKVPRDHIVPMPPIARATTLRRDDVWVEACNGVDWMVCRGRGEDGYIDSYEYARIPYVPCSTDGYGVCLPYVNGRYVELRLSHVVPFAVVERTYLNQLPDGVAKDGVRRMLRDYLAF